MDRLFTHHDRLVLFQSSFFNGTTSPTAPNDSETTTPAASPTSQDVAAPPVKAKAPPAHTGFALYIPHFHKLFGLMAIMNMLLYETPYYQTNIIPKFGKTKLAIMSIVHVILALSSFEFKIGRQRNGMYTIYREMQLHTVVFTLRSWTVLLCDFVFGIENVMYRLGLVMVWHVAADIVTKFYKPPSGETTIRRAVNGKPGYQYLGFFGRLGIWFFGFSQLVGTFLMVTDTADAARMAMFVMVPVQISAFLATLVRKGLLSNQVSITCYFLSIVPIFFYHHWTALDVACLVAAQVLRFNIGLSKYPMWFLLCSVAAFFKGDLFSLASTVVAPVVNGFAGQVVVTPDMLQYLQIPATTLVPAWMYTETWQLGTAIGQLYTQLTA